MSDSQLPDIEQLPVLPDMAQDTDFSIATGVNGVVIIYHKNPFPEPVEYLEFDNETHDIMIAYETGRIQNIGLTFNANMISHIQSAHELFIVQVEDGLEKEILKRPIYIR